MANTLFLRLEGPLQAWGERGRWSIRDTAPEPSKSGVIGLVACALGHNTDERIAPLAEKTRMGVRCDLPGQIITDYHIVGGGYGYATLLTAEGKAKKGADGRPHNEISWRDYLCDASFLVALQSDDESLIEQIAHALQNPVWPVFLGRKSCPPSRPVFEGVGQYQSLEEALIAGKWDKKPSTAKTVRGVIETDALRGIRHRDQTISRRYRLFGPRYTETVPIPVPQEE